MESDFSSNAHIYDLKFYMLQKCQTKYLHIIIKLLWICINFNKTVYYLKSAYKLLNVQLH